MAKLRKIDAKVFSDHFEPEEEEQGEVTEWSPSLSGSQQELFESTSKYILAYGERASGKTFVLGGHKLASPPRLRKL